MTDHVDDAPQGVVDTTKPVALPDTTAPASGQGDAAGTPATETPAAETPAAEPTPAPKKDPPWFVTRLDKQRQDIAARDARIAELERAQRQPAPAQPQGTETGTERPLTQADVDRLAADRAADIARTTEFNSRCNAIAEAGQKAFPDFMDAIGTFRHLGGLPPVLIEAAGDTENPAAVLYTLGKNPDEAARVLALSPARMGAAVAKIAARPAPSQPVSKAPAPLTPVAATARAEADPSKMSMSEWMKWRDAQDAKKSR